MLRASFGVLNIFTIMSRVWASLFGSECNHHFGLKVMRLKGSNFNFRGLRLLLQLLLTIGLTSDALAYFYLSDWKLRFNPSVPCLSRPWVGDVYLHTLILHVVPHSES